jgi:hypothetical protein
MAGMKEVFDELDFQGRGELVGLNKLILRRIARSR